jgi:hypothetical protein
MIAGGSVLLAQLGTHAHYWGWLFFGKAPIGLGIGVAVAMAAEAGIALDFDFIDRIGRTTPTLAKIAPSGPHGVSDLGRLGRTQDLGVAVHGGAGYLADRLAAHRRLLGMDQLAELAQHRRHAARMRRRGRSSCCGARPRPKARSSRSPASRDRCGGSAGRRACSRSRRTRSPRSSGERSRRDPPSWSATRDRAVAPACARCSARRPRWSGWGRRRRSDRDRPGGAPDRPRCRLRGAGATALRLRRARAHGDPWVSRALRPARGPGQSRRRHAAIASIDSPMASRS